MSIALFPLKVLLIAIDLTVSLNDGAGLQDEIYSFNHILNNSHYIRFDSHTCTLSLSLFQLIHQSRGLC